MRHELKQIGSHNVIALKGEVDLQHSPAARKLILEALGQGRPLVVELSGVSYMDSSGVASLVEGLQLAKKRGLGFALAGAGTPVLNVLRLARLDRVFALHDTLEAALG